ncbi:Gfo/Idh/MocA family protein [Planctomicrobium piriforme]|uniref:Predicted dehydrogenase n=1 Tax=Planctomicrobium piriforme TaxID=1576369 RepID=A0A1I3IH40_9PLAN|nr:Gfo/Idh/MocA family oxidoreductase [Planctomicrobium piriforme]SFI47210.1 Predicted dehydrogenase [Planctomicrobium piriforme]
MSLTRRYFLKSAAAIGAAAAVHHELRAQESKPIRSPNEKIGAAVIGTGSRGGEHIAALMGRDDVTIRTLCDADLANAATRAKGIESKGGQAPQIEQDFRRVLDDPSIEIVSIATPNHWHSLHAILALQAGKHVYVEKPVSHNVWEGRQLVNWARQLGKICQCGTQSRSSPSLQEAVKYVKEGRLGKIEYAIGTCYKPRKSIGKLDKPLQIPATVDYDLWCGPAAMVDLYRPQFHYDWHWDFNTGNGDMGNQGIHQMDIARWFLGEGVLSPRLMSIGGRVGYEDAGNTPNTQIVYHAYEKAPLIFETRGLPRKDVDYSTGMDNFRGSQVGVIVQCEKGYMVVPNYTQATAFDQEGKPLESWSSKGDANARHFANFFDAIRSGKHEDLNADILEGHLSSALCHTGAISHLLGTPKKAAEIEKEVAGNKLWEDSYKRMAEHLAANGVDINDPKLHVGPWLEMDQATERFTNNDAANKLLTRDYRKGYVVPDAIANQARRSFDGVN